jgi:hypothetical protein
MQMSRPRELRVIQRPLARPATQDHDQSDISAGWSVALLPFHVSGGFATAYVPIQPSDSNEPTEIAIVGLNTNTIRPPAPFREIVIAGDEQIAYFTLTANDGVPNGIARIDLATGAQTLLGDGFYGNLIAVTNVGS